MAKEQMSKLTIKNYGCLRDVSIPLTPLHAFIGPNDSGKSAILHAVRTIIQFATGKFGKDANNKWTQPFNPYVHGVSRLELGVLLQNGLRYCLTPTDSHNPAFPVVETVYEKEKTVQVRSEKRSIINEGIILKSDHISEPVKQQMHVLQESLSSARLLRLDPDSLRKQSRLLTDDEIVNLQNERGEGLPGIYGAIMDRDVETFLSIQKNVKNLFPEVKKLKLKTVTGSKKILAVELDQGEEVTAEWMSGGLLYYLAFAAIPHIEPTSVLLIEEPENGFHPVRITDIMKILREISKTTQVLLTTHSPLVVNELKTDEVSVVIRKSQTGTQVTPIRETPDFEERAKIYALGELWLNYANGECEEPLFKQPGGANA